MNALAQEDTVFVDSLIIGSGLAGINLARKLAEAGQKVFLCSKDAVTEGSSKYAQGGIAVVSPLNAEDSMDSHIQDTIEAGHDLCDENSVKTIVHAGWGNVNEIIELGVEFDKSFNLEGSHSYPRVIHRKDATGRAVLRPLLDKVSRDTNIQISQGTYCLSLTKYGERVVGAVLETISGEEIEVFAENVVLATGGLASIFPESTNPHVCTGDGIALAYDAGAKIENLEFIQFHPTVFKTKSGENFLISEAVRGAGALLRNSKEELFANKYHPKAELATRDIVSRAIVQEMKATNSEHVFLDFREMPEDKLLKEFPGIFEKSRENGYDLRKDLLPVSPAAHYTIGGIKTDLNGTSNISGLFAIGEVASTGLHGANRLASNSLLECLAMSDFAAKAIINAPSSRIKLEELHNSDEFYDALEYCSDYSSSNLAEVQEIISDKLGLERNKSKIKKAIAELEQLEDSIEKTVALIVARSANRREESRGAHFRLDFPRSKDVFKRGTIISKASVTANQATSSKPIDQEARKLFISKKTLVKA